MSPPDTDKAAIAHFAYCYAYTPAYAAQLWAKMSDRARKPWRAIVEGK